MTLHRVGAAALLAPGLVVIGAFFVLPIIGLLTLSFTANGGVAVNYGRFFAQPVYLARYDPAKQQLVTDTEPAGSGTAPSK